MNPNTLDFEIFDIPSLPDAVGSPSETVERVDFPELLGPRELDQVISGVQEQITKNMESMKSGTDAIPTSIHVERLMHMIYPGLEGDERGA